MVTLFVRTRVADYQQWRRVYDDFEAERQSMGVVGDAVYQLDGDPNDVTFYHHFETVEAAKSFTSSESVRDVIRRAGVLGQPDIWLTRPAG